MTTTTDNAAGRAHRVPAGAGPPGAGPPGFTHWRVWGTTVALGVHPAPAGPAATELVRGVIAEFDDACNRFRADSELGRVNRAGGRPVAVSPRLLEALHVALDAAERTGGAVDPTVANSLEALGYDRDYEVVAAGDPAGPLPGTPAAAAGWRTVALAPGAGTVQVPAGVHLDLGATAKALCADAAARAVADSLGVGVLVDIGGDLATAGPAPAGGWRVSVMACARTTTLARDVVVAVQHGGLASSGTTARTWARAGRPLHHIVDPGTGWPAPPVWGLVTVAGPSCLEANVAATAAVVWGADAPFELAQRGLPARFVAADGSVTTVGGWPPDASGAGTSGT